MVGSATAIKLNDQERAARESCVGKPTTGQRMVQRARIGLEAAAGKTTKEIAPLMQVRPATVSTRRTRFARDRGQTRPGRGSPPPATRRRSRAPWRNWTTRRRRGKGRLVAQALGVVSASQVWRVLRKHGIQLQRRRSWCVSIDPSLCKRRPTCWLCLWTRRRKRWRRAWKRSPPFSGAFPPHPYPRLLAEPDRSGGTESPLSEAMSSRVRGSRAASIPAGLSEVDPICQEGRCPGGKPPHPQKVPSGFRPRKNWPAVS